MEYLERGSLRPLVAGLKLAQATGVLEGLLAGLAHAQSRGIVHRDLKPENLMVTPEGSVKIADFGIAKAYNRLSTSQFHTRTGTTIGTPTYMAPEQATAKDVGPWTDLYATGVIAYELLVGQVPFLGTETPMSLLWRHVNDPVPPPQVIKPELDPALCQWIERMLAKAPADRPASAQAAWEELEEAVVAVLGPRWRRGARLPQGAAGGESDKPLTPAPFGGQAPSPQEAGERDDSFVTYDRAPSPPAEPPPATAEPAAPSPDEELEPRRSRRFQRSAPVPRPEERPDVRDHPGGTGAEDADPALAQPAAVEADDTIAPRLRGVAEPRGTEAPAPSLKPDSRSDGRGPVSRRSRLPWVVGVLLALTAGAAGVLLLLPQREPTAGSDKPTTRLYRTDAYTAVS